MPAGVPSQAAIMKEVIAECKNRNNSAKINDFLTFIKDAFKRADTSLDSLQLEDFFSPLDRCIYENSSFRGYPLKDIIVFRDQLASLISDIIDKSIKYNETEYIDEFVAKLSDCEDHTIITSNWDNLIEQSFYKKYSDKFTIDYGTLVTEMGDGKESQRVLAEEDKHAKCKILKVYKIHGSVDWFNCPLCNRLFIPKKPADLDMSCRFCTKIFKNKINNGKNEVALDRSLILPTFLKEFGNFHYKSIWHHIHRELSEAKHLVLIGYSMPSADFEIRQSFLRFVPDNCDILIVTAIDNEKDITFENNYKSLFGERTVDFDYDGVKDYIKSLSHDIIWSYTN